MQFIDIRGSPPFCAIKRQVTIDAKNTRNQAFSDAVEELPFTIFQCTADLGHYGWRPNVSEGGYMKLSDVTVNDFSKRISVTLKPPKVLSTISTINRQCPLPFKALPPQSLFNAFPYNSSYASALHVAAAERELDLDQVDFVFGGSTLQMLATQVIDDCQYLVSVLPLNSKTETRNILIAKHKEYVQNYADPGFQFERVVTGQRMEDRHDEIVFEHLHVMRVGKYQVLFAAECDATDAADNPVEIKASNPRYWGTKVMFQMISSGSLLLYAGSKYPRNTLCGVKALTLAQVAHKALQHENAQHLQARILQNMGMIREEIKLLMGKAGGQGKVFELYFQDGNLKLRKYPGNANTLLPPTKVLKELIGI